MRACDARSHIVVGDVLQIADVHLFLVDGATGHLNSESNKQAVKAYCFARGATQTKKLTKADWEGDTKTFWLTTKMDRCNDQEYTPVGHMQGWDLMFPVKEGLCEAPKIDSCFKTAVGDLKKMQANFSRITEVNQLESLYVSLPLTNTPLISIDLILSTGTSVCMEYTQTR